MASTNRVEPLNMKSVVVGGLACLKNMNRKSTMNKPANPTPSATSVPNCPNPELWLNFRTRKPIAVVTMT